MWEAIKDVAQSASHWELSTWAGILNLAGFAITAPETSVLETITDWVSGLIEGSRIYRDPKRTEPYAREAEKLSKEKPALWKRVVWMLVYVAGSVVIIAAAKTLTPPLLAK